MRTGGGLHVAHTSTTFEIEKEKDVVIV